MDRPAAQSSKARTVGRIDQTLELGASNESKSSRVVEVDLLGMVES